MAYRRGVRQNPLHDVNDDDDDDNDADNTGNSCASREKIVEQMAHVWSNEFLEKEK